MSERKHPLTPLGRALSEIVRQECRSRGLSMSGLARLSGINRHRAARLERGTTGWKLESIEAISVALNMTPSEFLAAAEKKLGCADNAGH